MSQPDTREQRSIDALREPHYTLARAPNTIRQAIAEVIEDQRKQIDRYGLALMMISEGCADPAACARKALDAPSKETPKP